MLFIKDFTVYKVVASGRDVIKKGSICLAQGWFGFYRLHPAV